MRNTLLYQTLQLLQPDEFHRLGVFLESPLFNNSTLSNKCIELYLILKKTRIKEIELTKTTAFKSIYPNKPFNQRLLDNVMHALLEVVRQFILIEDQMQPENQDYKLLALAKFYRERQLDKRFTQTIEALRRKRKKETQLLSADLFYKNYLIEHEQFEFENLHNQKNSDLNLNALLNQFIQFHLLKGLELILLLHHQSKLTVIDTEIWEAFKNQSLNLAESYKHFSNPLIKLLYMALSLNTGETKDEHFEGFLQLFEAQEVNLSRPITQQLAGMARHYCVSQVNLGRTPFRKKLLDIYKNHLEKGWLYENDRILQAILFNVVNVALLEKQHDWALEILEKHRYRITGSEYPEVIYFLIRANCFFYQNEFDQAADSLNSTFAELADRESRSNLNDIGLNKMTRLLEVKILYEKDPHSTVLTDKLNAFKMYVHRNHHLTEDKKKLDNNFIDMLKKLLSTSNRNNKIKLEKLEKQLNDSSFRCAEQNWLKNKVKNLIADH